jgi:hypothetical protein
MGAPIVIGLWVKGISLLLEGLEISKHIYDVGCMKDML